MITRTTPHVYYRSTCRDAVTFYRSIFGGSAEIHSFGDLGMDGDPSDVLSASLTVGGTLVLTAGDVTVGSPAATGGSVSVDGDDEAEARRWFAALAEAGDVHMPFEAAAWGGHFGQCSDRFGVTWLVHVAQDG